MAHISEYEVEDIFIGRLESIGYKFIKLDNYDDVLANFREQLAKFNAKKLTEKGHDASFSDAEFNRIMIHVDNHSVYESAKILSLCEKSAPKAPSGTLLVRLRLLFSV